MSDGGMMDPCVCGHSSIVHVDRLSRCLDPSAHCDCKGFTPSAHFAPWTSPDDPHPEATSDFVRYIASDEAPGDGPRCGGELLAMLRELEWSGDAQAVNLCPVCFMRLGREVAVPGEPADGMPGFVSVSNRKVRIPGGHAPDCRLDALLRRYRRG